MSISSSSKRFFNYFRRLHISYISKKYKKEKKMVIDHSKLPSYFIGNTNFMQNLKNTKLTVFIKKVEIQLIQHLKVL